ncbi:MAG: radical SAM protein, partial [Betaproteobacteria bacterium]|nr:radical SAM protein [Betaproteobacteria bacterium]
MTQLNTPYPSTAYLTGFLRSQGVEAVQEDLALGLVLAVLTPQALGQVRSLASALPAKARSPSVQHFLQEFAGYESSISPVIAFLQGRDSTLSHRIAGRGFLPEGPRFAALDAYGDDDAPDPLAWAFGALGQNDRARHLATLYLNDLADVLRDAVDPRFAFVRYGESLAASAPSFDALAQALAAPPNL